MTFLGGTVNICQDCQSLHLLIMSFGNLAAHFKQAFNRPEFRSSMADVLLNTVMSPHLFRKVAVPGICVS